MEKDIRNSVQSSLEAAKAGAFTFCWFCIVMYMCVWCLYLPFTVGLFCLVCVAHNICARLVAFLSLVFEMSLFSLHGNAYSLSFSGLFACPSGDFSYRLLITYRALTLSSYYRQVPTCWVVDSGYLRHTGRKEWGCGLYPHARLPQVNRTQSLRKLAFVDE